MKQIPNALRLWALALLASFVFFGCGKKESAGGGDGKSSDTASSGSASASGAATGSGSGVDAPAGQGDSEAVKAVCDELAKHWVKTGDGWVSEFPSQVSLATGKRAGPESYSRQ